MSMLNDVEVLENHELRRAVVDAADVVNANAGRTYVRLWFADEPSEIDFIANSAAVKDGRFHFQAGIDSYTGTIEELAAISTELIAN